MENVLTLTTFFHEELNSKIYPSLGLINRPEQGQGVLVKEAGV
jgi:hypothetical protein